MIRALACIVVLGFVPSAVKADCLSLIKGRTDGYYLLVDELVGFGSAIGGQGLLLGVGLGLPLETMAFAGIGAVPGALVITAAGVYRASLQRRINFARMLFAFKGDRTNFDNLSPFVLEEIDTLIENEKLSFLKKVLKFRPNSTLEEVTEKVLALNESESFCRYTLKEERNVHFRLDSMRSFAKQVAESLGKVEP